MGDFRRVGSSGAAAPGIGLANVPRKSDSHPSPARVQNRLKELQALCTSDCEALLFVAGVDGKYNEGSRKALNFLLYGCSGNEITQSSTSDADLSDGLLVVSANMCFLHLGNSKAYWKFLPTLGPIADLQLSAPTEEEEKDVDLVEERKILCFLEAISNFKTVGVELSGADPMEVEKWPLIQVYGIEELGGQGFFTMRHKVLDRGAALNRIYLQLDAQAAQTLITYHSDLLAYHWLMALQNLDKASVHERMKMSEAMLIDPLQSFFSFGLLRNKEEGGAGGDKRIRPRATFGIRTNLVDNTSDESATVSNSGVAGKEAVHFTVEAAEPNGPIRVARTYFLSNGGAGARPLTFDYDGLETQEENNALERGGRSAYARCLMMAYCALVHVHKKLVAAFCRGQARDEQALRALALAGIQELYLDWFRNYDVPANLEVTLSACDTGGSRADAARGSRHAKYLKLALRHISSLDATPMDLGAVVFGETFLEPPTSAHEALVLTQQIEPHCAWLAAGQEEDTEGLQALISRLRYSRNNRHYTMGALILMQKALQLKTDAIQGVRLLTGLPEIPTIHGQVWVLERGLIFSSLRLGSIALDFSKHVASLSLFNTAAQARDDDKAAVLSFELKCSLQRYGILEATLALPRQSFVLSSGAEESEAVRRLLIRDVLPQWLGWFKAQELECRLLDALPAGFSEVQPLSYIDWKAEPVTVNVATQPAIQAYLSALQTLDASLHSSDGCGAAAALGCEDVEEHACRVVVFLGEPGCDKYKLVQGAMELAGLTATAWKLVSYKHPHSPMLIDAAELAATLLAALPNVPTGGGGGMAVVVSSCASAWEVDRAVRGNRKLQSKLYLERMVAVVNATSMLCPGNIAHEAQVAAQCSPGLVSSIVLVNIEALGDRVDEMQQRLRCINSLAPIIPAVAGRVSARRDMESLFPLNADEEPWCARHKVRAIRQQLCSHLSGRAESEGGDAWSSRRGPMALAEIPIPDNVVFVRPLLVRAFRSLFASPRETLGKYIEEKRATRGPAPMELTHVSAIVDLVQSERPEDIVNSKLYVVKAKRGNVTFTKCSAADAQLRAGVRVSGRNLNANKLMTILFEARKPIPAPRIVREARDVTKEERTEILEGAERYALPEGVFFNGSKYINWEGETLKEHPCMPEMISDYLKQEHLDVARFNEDISVRRREYQEQLDRCLAHANKITSQALQAS